MCLNQCGRLSHKESSFTSGFLGLQSLLSLHQFRVELQEATKSDKICVSKEQCQWKLPKNDVKTNQDSSGIKVC